MTSDNLLIVCRSCSRKILMHNMRPDSTGENMVCIDCYRKNNASKTVSISEAAAEQTRTVKKVVSTGPMSKYICTSCKYKFSKKADHPVTKCPYCGKTNIVSDNQLGADTLLHDSMDRKFENW